MKILFKIVAICAIQLDASQPENSTPQGVAI